MRIEHQRTQVGSTLEDVGIGQRVRVVGVRHPTDSRDLAQSGIRPGAELRCVDLHPGAVVVATETGRWRTLDRTVASWLAVELLNDGE